VPEIIILEIIVPSATIPLIVVRTVTVVRAIRIARIVTAGYAERVIRTITVVRAVFGRIRCVLDERAPRAMAAPA
jgi:hypothetical protein